MALHHLVTSRPLPSLRRWAAAYAGVHLDLGTGDGQFAIQLARRNPALAVIGIDICLDHLHGSLRRRPGNLRFLNADARDWSPGALPVADAVTINFPYGSLLRGLVEGDAGLIARLGAVLGPGSRLEVRANETALIATDLDPATGPLAITRTLREVDGLRVVIRELGQAELRSYPSSWSKRLGYGRPTNVFILEAVR